MRVSTPVGDILMPFPLLSAWNGVMPEPEAVEKIPRGPVPVLPVVSVHLTPKFVPVPVPIVNREVKDPIARLRLWLGLESKP